MRVRGSEGQPMTRSRRALTLSTAGLLLVGASVAVPRRGGKPAPAAHVLADASRPWRALAALAFLGAFACPGGGGPGALTGAGGGISPRRAAARLGIGAAVN